jgi:hypothetical protein
MVGMVLTRHSMLLRLWVLQVAVVVVFSAPFSAV